MAPHVRDAGRGQEGEGGRLPSPTVSHEQSRDPGPGATHTCGCLWAAVGLLPLVTKQEGQSFACLAFVPQDNSSQGFPDLTNLQPGRGRVRKMRRLNTCILRPPQFLQSEACSPAFTPLFKKPERRPTLGRRWAACPHSLAWCERRAEAFLQFFLKKMG